MREVTSLLKILNFTILREVTSLVKTVLRYHNPYRDDIKSEQY